jgi:hypothetical protein
MAVPVAIRLAIVGLALEQNVCGVVPVGAAGLLTVTDTAKRIVLSQPPVVWLA